jgi:hypothetical protein
MIEPANLILAWVIGSAIFAIPASITSKLVKTKLSGFGWAFIATLLSFIYSVGLGYFVENLYFAIPLMLVGSILIYTLALQTSIPKAALVWFAQFAIASVIMFKAAWLLGGEFGFHAYGHGF